MHRSALIMGYGRRTKQTLDTNVVGFFFQEKPAESSKSSLMFCAFKKLGVTSFFQTKKLMTSRVVNCSELKKPTDKLLNLFARR